MNPALLSGLASMHRKDVDAMRQALEALEAFDAEVRDCMPVVVLEEGGSIGGFPMELWIDARAAIWALEERLLER